MGPSAPSITHISHSGPLRSTGTLTSGSVHFGQFLRTAGVPDGDAVNVPVDVEVGVGNPCRVVEIEARVGKLLLKGRDSAHAHPQCLAEPFEVVTAGNRRGIQFQHW